MTLSSSCTKMFASVLILLLLAMPVWAQKPATDKAIDDYNFAAWLYNQGKYPLAKDSYQGFLRAYPDHEKAADARFGLAQSFFYQDQFKEAAEEYEILRNRHGSFSQTVEALFQLAQCRVALDQLGRAEPLFGEVRARFGSHYLADWSVARQAACHISLGRFPEAEELLKGFLEKYAPGEKKAEESEATRAMFRRLDEAGVKAQDAFLSLVERSEFYYAIAQFNRERYADARVSFRRFLERHRQSTLKDEAQFRLAQSLYQEKVYAEAAEAYAAVAPTGEFAEGAAFERGLALYKAGRLGEAATVFADLTRRFPKSEKVTQASLYAGTFLYETGDYAGAAARLRPLAEAKKEQADEAAYWLGMCLLKQGRNADAEKQFSQSLLDFPNSVRAKEMRLGLGDALLAQDKLPEAAAAFRSFAQSAAGSDQAPRALYSACVALHRADQYPESDRLCAEFLASYAADPLAAQVLFLSGENRFLAKDFDRSGTRYRELIKHPQATPENVARAHYRLAWVHRQARDFKTALAELDGVTPAAGKAIVDEVLYLRGVCLLESGRPAEAADALERYLKSAERSRYGDDAWLRLAAAQTATGKKDRAMDAYERFLKEFKSSDLASQARYSLAELYLEARQFDKAIGEYEKILAVVPAGDLAPFALLGRGVCRDEQSRWPDALASYDALLKNHPKSELVPQALYRKGRTLMKLKRWEEATASLNQLLENYPKHDLSRPARVSLGYSLQEQKKWREAAQAFGAAAEQDAKAEDQSRVQYEQAWSWREAGDVAASLQAFRALVRSFPTDPLAADANFHLGEAAYAEAVAGGKDGVVPAKPLAEAREQYEKVLSSKEAKRLGDKARYRMGWTYWLGGKYGEAAREFDQLTKDFSASELMPDALFQSGQSHARSGQATQAVERYRTLVETAKFSAFPFIPEAYVGLGEGLLSTGDPQAALKILGVMTARYGDHAAAADAFFLKGKAHYDLAQYDEALIDFQEVTRRSRAEVAARAQFYSGQVFQMKEDFRQALVAYLRIQALYPQYGEWVAAGMFESGKCQQALGSAEEAQKAYREVVKQFKGTRWAELAAERLKSL